MFAGFTLMLDRPFRVGDRIQLGTGEVGDVLAIGTRVTRIHTADDSVLVVPNSLLTKERLVNLSMPSRHLVTRIEVAVAYGSDLGVTKRLLAESALFVESVDQERQPLVLITSLANQAVTLLLLFWVRDYLEQLRAKSAVHEEICRRFAAGGIELAVPTRRIIHEPDQPEA
jgi:small-conductance mechanosensitive channel